MKGWPPNGVPTLFAVLAAVLTSTASLIRPALVNSYPILFSDTGGLPGMGVALDMNWDKPWVHGPFLLPTSLYLALQRLLSMQGPLSHLLHSAAIRQATRAAPQSAAPATMRPGTAPAPFARAYPRTSDQRRLDRKRASVAGQCDRFAYPRKFAFPARPP